MALEMKLKFDLSACGVLDGDPEKFVREIEGSSSFMDFLSRICNRCEVSIKAKRVRGVKVYDGNCSGCEINAIRQIFKTDEGY